MKIQELSLSGLKLFQPSIFKDQRGYFLETFRAQCFLEGELKISFVQDNHSFSKKKCLRGMHFQKGNQQDKMVFVIKGKIFDVAVDIRKKSPTFGKWEAVILDDQNHHQLLIPKGFAHGFCVLSQEAYVYYKVSSYYDPLLEMGFCWNDSDVNIHWPISHPIVSEKDKTAPQLKELEL